LNGEVAPSALAALPLAYNWPLDMGFVNFSLSAAMALLVFALWIRLRALGFFTRFLVFAPLSFATWVAHLAGWGILGLAVLGFELVREYRMKGVKVHALISAAFETFPFALMIAFTILWRGDTSSPLGAIYNSDLFVEKFKSLATIFREAHMPWDLASSVAFLVLVIAFFILAGRRIVPTASVIAILLMFAFSICPEEFFKSVYADRRLLPYAAIFVALSVGVSERLHSSEQRRQLLSLAAMGAIAFFVARLAVTTIEWAAVNRSFAQHLTLLDQIPPQSRIFGLMVEPCDKSWQLVGKLDHLQQLAVTRRESVINGLFEENGLNQVETRYRKLDGLGPNMRAAVQNDSCFPYSRITLKNALALFPRDDFDYVWLLTSAPLPVINTAGLHLIGSSNDDRLYRIDH
jgi:hypothetical protein